MEGWGRAGEDLTVCSVQVAGGHSATGPVFDDKAREITR